MDAIVINSPRRYAHIDALRAVAVLIVVVGHAGIPMMPGDAGVTIFFVISGFVITHLLLREREDTGSFNIRRFYVHRALKLAPPFLILIVIPTLIYAFWGPVHWPAFISQILFTYNWAQILSPETGWLILPGSNVTWSLAVEEQFYIVFAVVWLLLVGKRWWRSALTALAILAVLASNVIRVGVYASGDALRIIHGTDTRMDAIAWGVLAALVYKLWRDRQHRALMAWVGTPWALAGAAFLFLASFAVPGDLFAQTSRYTLHSVIAAVVILYGLIAQDRLSSFVGRVSASRVVTVIGLSSYSIYLVHDVLFHGLADVVGAFPPVVASATLTLIGILAGIVSYHSIERPALAFKTRQDRRVRAAEAGGNTSSTRRHDLENAPTRRA